MERNEGMKRRKEIKTRERSKKGKKGLKDGRNWTRREEKEVS